MKLRKKGSWVMWYESAAFGVVIALCWVEEWTGLGNLVFGGEKTHAIDWRAATMITLLILLVWAVVLWFTKRLVTHLLYLEGFLRVCSWCRKIGYQDKWIPLEEYFQKGFHVGTTHGVCPECLAKEKEETSQFFRRQSTHEPEPDGDKLGMQPNPKSPA